jgi:hypothetical protein
MTTPPYDDDFIGSTAAEVQPGETCQTNTGAGQVCGAPAVATIASVLVCASCAEDAAGALDFLREMLGGEL